MIDLPPIPDITLGKLLLGKFEQIQKAQAKKVISAVFKWEDAQ